MTHSHPQTIPKACLLDVPFGKSGLPGMAELFSWFLAVLLVCSGDLAAKASAATGPITIATDYPHSFRYQSGERFFPMGDTAYYLIAQPTNLIAHYIDVRRAHKFNFIRMMSLADGFWPFGGTPQKPDYTAINETALQKWDWVFDYAATKGMNIELILFGYGLGGGEGLWTNTVHQNRWIDTLVKRVKDRPNLFMYTIANEFERYPNGAYAFEARDVEWAKSVAARIRILDTMHPIGVHPSTWITDQNPSRTYQGFTQRRPQVVWPLWEDGLINLNITQNNEGVQPRTWGNFGVTNRGLTYYPTNWQGVFFPVNWVTNGSDIGWDFEGAGMEDCIAEDWAHGKPVLNTEFGYQYETDYEPYGFMTRQVHLPSTVRKKAWKIATAGGYFAAGFRSAAVTRLMSINSVDNFRPEHLETLYDFFTTRTEYWKMEPHLELVASHNVLLALPGTEYVAYFPRGGTNSIKLEAGTYSVEWLRAETGQYYPMPALRVASGSREFVPPNHPDADWVLHLKQQAAVTLRAPTDGGSPLHPTNLVAIAAHHYQLRAEKAETNRDTGMRLAQFMVEAANHTPTPQTITIELADGKNAYCYYRTPSGAWRRTDLRAGARGPSLQLSLAPGVTRIASIPWFTYGEYLAYINSLQDSRITKEVAFTDAGGQFKTYRLRVTNPTGVKNKLKICFGKAQHAHETSAFFMTQGILEWLLSGDPAANLDNTVWTFYPCADPKAAYHHLSYNEVEQEKDDTGKRGRASYYDELAAGHHHLLQVSHMWNNEGHNLEFESYEYWDPSAGSTNRVIYPAEGPESRLYRDWMAYWPHWYEWGTDTYWHRNARAWPPMGGGVLMLNEIYYYGKDSGGDVAANLRRQGKKWARAVSQVYLQFQQASNYWTASHPCGAVDVTGAVLLPRPVHMLAETLLPISGAVQTNRNAHGKPMVIFHKHYDHGLGMQTGQSVTYNIPPGANVFKTVVALDDAQTKINPTAQFVIQVNGKEAWRSAVLGKYQSELAHVKLPGSGQVTLSVEGPAEVLGNWAGAKFTVNDPD